VSAMGDRLMERESPSQDVGACMVGYAIALITMQTRQSPTLIGMDWAKWKTLSGS
jgi:hypothetical protein